MQQIRVAFEVPRNRQQERLLGVEI